MNDNDLEILEEYQSDNIYDLVHERKKSKAVQNILHKSSNNKNITIWSSMPMEKQLKGK